jgi:hypothetical protein
MKPVLLLDCDFLNNIYGRGANFNAERGNAILDRMRDSFEMKITQTVYRESVQNPARYPKDRAVMLYIMNNKIEKLALSDSFVGKDAGERSMVKAIKELDFGKGRDVYIASDDRRFFSADGEGSAYSHLRLKSEQVLSRAGDILARFNESAGGGGSSGDSRARRRSVAPN